MVVYCNPIGGKHPHVSEVCASLNDSRGSFENLNVDSSVYCAMMYSPVTVGAEGVWRGRRISYQETFGNPCELRKATGNIFNF